MSNKNNIFISFLGTGDYLPVNYKYNRGAFKTPYVQEAIIKGLLKNINFKNYYIITTKSSFKKHWQNSLVSFKHNGKNISYNSLFTRFKRYKILHNVIVIKGGEFSNNDNIEKNLWEILGEVNKSLPENSNVYLDITHSFRYIPMFVIVMLNYLKATKNIKVKGIFYGDIPNNGESVIRDITFIYTLQEWSNAIHIFNEFGVIKKLDPLVNDLISKFPKSEKKKKKKKKKRGSQNQVETIYNHIRNIANLIYYTRGMYIHFGLNKLINTVLSNINQVKLLVNTKEIKEKYPMLVMISSLLDYTRGKLKKYTSNDEIIAIFKAAEWAVDHKLPHAAVTLMREGIVSAYIKAKHPKDFKQKLYDKTFREQITREMFYESPEEPDLQKIIKLFEKVRMLRNDLNHAGFVKKVPNESNINIKQIEVFEKNLMESIKYRLDIIKKELNIK